MRVLMAVILFLSFWVSGAAQPPDSLWSRRFGGGDDEICYTVRQTQDGNFLLAGSTGSFGAGFYDFWLVKVGANGDSLWCRTYGGTDFEVCRSMEPTRDGGYILGGETSSFGSGNTDFWLVKVDANGDSMWSRSYGGGDTETCYSVCQTADSGYILAGITSSFGPEMYNFWVVKTNAYGDSLWSRTFGTDQEDMCWSVQQTRDGGYILGGHTWSSDWMRRSAWIIKTDSSGDSVWSRTIGDSYYECLSILQTTDDGYICAGSASSFDDDFWIAKLSVNGDSLWSRTFGGTAGDRCTSIQRTADGGYILGGYTDSFGNGMQDFWLLRTNNNGDSLWSETFGSSGTELCFSVQQTTGGGYVLAGETWTAGANDDDFWVVYTEPEMSVIEPPLPQDLRLLSNYPNPFNAQTMVEFAVPRRSQVMIRVCDLLGRDVRVISDAVYAPGRYTIPWECRGCASGVYWISMTGDGFHLARKTILLR